MTGSANEEPRTQSGLRPQPMLRRAGRVNALDCPRR
jgi:hypothetical protein